MAPTTKPHATRHQTRSVALIATVEGNICEDGKPWDRLTPDELAAMRKRWRQSQKWTPSEVQIKNELGKLGRGPANKDKFRRQWDKDLVDTNGGIGDDHAMQIERPWFQLAQDELEAMRRRKKMDDNSTATAPGKLIARKPKDLGRGGYSSNNTLATAPPVHENNVILLNQKKQTRSQDRAPRTGAKQQESIGIHKQNHQICETSGAVKIVNLGPEVIVIKDEDDSDVFDILGARMGKDAVARRTNSHTANPPSLIVKLKIAGLTLSTLRPGRSLLHGRLQPPPPTPISRQSIIHSASVDIAETTPLVPTPPKTFEAANYPRKYGPELLLPLFSSNELNAIRKRNRKSNNWTPGWVTMERELQRLGRCIPEVIMTFARMGGQWNITPASSNTADSTRHPPTQVVPNLKTIPVVPGQQPVQTAVRPKKPFTAPVASMSSIQNTRFDGFPDVDNDTEEEAVLLGSIPARPLSTNTAHAAVTMPSGTRYALSSLERLSYELAQRSAVWPSSEMPFDPDSEIFKIVTPQELQSSLRDLISRNNAFIPKVQSCVMILSPDYPLPPAPKTWAGDEWPKNISEMNKFIALYFNPEERGAKSATSTIQRITSKHIVALVSEVDGYEYQHKQTEHQTNGGWRREFVCRFSKLGRPIGRIAKETGIKPKKHDCAGVVKVGLLKRDGDVVVIWKHLAVHRSAVIERMEMAAKILEESPSAPTKIADALKLKEKKELTDMVPVTPVERELNMHELYAKAKAAKY